MLISCVVCGAGVLCLLIAGVLLGCDCQLHGPWCCLRPLPLSLVGILVHGCFFCAFAFQPLSRFVPVAGGCLTLVFVGRNGVNK